MLQHHRNDRTLLQRTCAIPDLGSDGGLHLLDDRSKCSLVEHSHVSQDLTVEFDRSLLQAVDEHAVGHVVLTHRCIDTRDPQCAEHTLLVAAIAIGVLACAHDRLLGDAIDVIATAAVTLGQVDDLLVAGPCGNPTFDSRHE
ncbi:conserved hypothetical protein [Paraburkholderia tropica]